MKRDLSIAETIETMIRIRDAKAKSAVVEKDEEGKDKVRLVPYKDHPHPDGVHYDGKGRKWIFAIDPAGNIHSVMLSTARDPRSPDAGTELGWSKKFERGIEAGGWVPLEKRPYGLAAEKWPAERERIIKERRGEAQERAMGAAPTQLEQLTALIRKDREEARTMVAAGEVPTLRGKRLPQPQGE